MSQENHPPNININLKNNNPGEEVPFITISNSKSNSSKNQNSKTSSNNHKISLTQNNNSSSNSKKNRQNSSFNIIRKKLSLINKKNNQDKRSSEVFTFTDNSLLNIYDTSPNENTNKISNLSLSEDQKEIQTEIKKTEKKPDIETPKKKYDNSNAIFQKIKITKKAVKPIDNIHGKNLMDFFKYMYTNINTEEKNKNRVSSVENISNTTFNLKKNTVNINKSWNKNNFAILNLIKKPIKFVNKNIFNDKKIKINNKIKIKESLNLSPISAINIKKYSNNFKISTLKKSQNIINCVDIANRLLKKYIPKKIIYNSNNKNSVFINNNYKYDKNSIYVEKKNNFEKIKKTPKSESYNREISNPYLKNRESAKKNLFHEIKPKINEELNINKNIPNKKRLSAKVINSKNPRYNLNDLYKMINNKNNLIKIKPIKKESNENKNNINIKRINNINETYSYFLKNKDKKDFPKQNEKNEQTFNKCLNFKNNNQKPKNKK